MPTPGKFFDTLVLIVLENHGWTQVQGWKFVNHFAQNGVVFTGWHGVTHPSGPNYRAMLSGNTWSGNEYDGVQRPNLGRSVDYKIYQYRGIPAQRHNPFLDMNPHGDARATNYLSGPMSNAGLAPLTYLGLDDANNAHNGPCSVADDNVMQAITEFNGLSAGGRKLLLTVFDEAYGKDYSSNHIFAGAIGTGVGPKQVRSSISHYSLAQFLADNWGVTISEMDPSGDTYAGLSLLDLP
jgi:hypothetical protein